LTVPPQFENDKVDPSSTAAVLGSPVMALLCGTLALVFSWMANSSYNNHSTLLDAIGHILSAAAGIISCFLVDSI
jgi:cell division inhibitor SulA